MLNTEEVFNPSDHKELDEPISTQQTIVDESAIAYLVAQGYAVSVL